MRSFVTAFKKGLKIFLCYRGFKTESRDLYVVTDGETEREAKRIKEVFERFRVKDL